MADVCSMKAVYFKVRFGFRPDFPGPESTDEIHAVTVLSKKCFGRHHDSLKLSIFGIHDDAIHARL